MLIRHPGLRLQIQASRHSDLEIDCHFEESASRLVISHKVRSNRSIVQQADTSPFLMTARRFTGSSWTTHHVVRPWPFASVEDAADIIGHIIMPIMFLPVIECIDWHICIMLLGVASIGCSEASCSLLASFSPAPALLPRSPPTPSLDHRSVSARRGARALQRDHTHYLGVTHYLTACHHRI